MSRKAPMCLVCRFGGTPENSGLQEFEEGWFHTKELTEETKYGPVRSCRERYERIVEELRPRYGYNAGTEDWAQFLEERPDWNPITYNVGNGWIGLVVNLTEALLLEHDNLQLIQLKEKFGGMRYYTNGLSEVGHALVGWAEHMSYSYCEVCGQFGKVREGGWIKTLCNEHYADQETRRLERLRNFSENYDPKVGVAMGMYPDKSVREE